MITSIKNYPNSEDLLLDKNWTNVDCYELCSRNEYWGCASFVNLEKKIKNVANEAILYILERLVIETEYWDAQMQADIDGYNFLNFIFDSGYIFDDNGFELSAKTFWIDFEEIKNGISDQETFTMTKNGIETKEEVSINKDDIFSVTCFSDDWNRKQYLVETQSHWIFFSWTTLV